MTGPRTLTCARPDIGGVGQQIYSGVKLAVSDSEFGLVWVHACYPPLIHFTRLALDFTILSDTVPIGSAPPAYARTSIASSSAGWLIAIASPEGISLLSFDKGGTATGSRDVSFSKRFGGSEETLVPRAGGDPLVMWVDGMSPGTLPSEGTLHAQLLSPDASAKGIEVTVLNTSVIGTAGVAVSDGFELAMTVRSGAPGDPGTIQLVHIALDGTSRMDARIPLTGLPNEAQTWLSLGWSGSELQLMYYLWMDAGEPAILLQRVTESGVLVGTPIHVVDLPSFGHFFFPMLAIGSDTVLLRATPPFGSSADVLRLNSSGSDVWPPAPVVRAPNIYSIAMVGQGSDAVIAWNASRDYTLTTSTLELARIRLTP